MKFRVIITEDIEDGGYNASVPALPGCYSQGATIEEATKNIKEAIEVYLESVGMEKFKHQPKIITTEVEV